jgi:transposase
MHNLTNFQKLEIIMRHESGKSQREIMASYNIHLSTIYDIKKWKDQLWSFMASSGSVKDLSKAADIRRA